MITRGTDRQATAASDASDNLQRLRRQDSGTPHDVLAGYVDVLRRRWAIVLAGTAAALAAAGLFLALVPRVYEAAVTLQVVVPRRSPFLTSYGVPGASTEVGTRSSAVARMKTVLESASLASNVIDELGLNKAPYAISYQRFLADHLVVSEVRSMDFLRLAVRLRDPALSARVANRMADLAAVQSRAQKQAQTKLLKQSVAQELEATRARLVQARARVREQSPAASSRLVRERRATSEPVDERRSALATPEEIDYSVVSRIYSDLRLQYEALAIEEAVTAADFRVTDPARPPSRPVYPDAPRTIAIGLAAGLVLSVMAAFVYDAIAMGEPAR